MECSVWVVWQRISAQRPQSTTGKGGDKTTPLHPCYHNNSHFSQLHQHHHNPSRIKPLSNFHLVSIKEPRTETRFFFSRVVTNKNTNPTRSACTRTRNAQATHSETLRPQGCLPACLPACQGIRNEPIAPRQRERALEENGTRKKTPIKIKKKNHSFSADPFPFVAVSPSPSEMKHGMRDEEVIYTDNAMFADKKC